MNISQEFFKSKKIAELCFHSWPKLWRWTEDNFWILRNSRGHHMEIWMGKKMVGNVQAVSFTMQNSSMKSCNIRFIHKRENCNKWVQKVWKQKVSLSPIRQLKKSDKKLMILGSRTKNPSNNNHTFQQSSIHLTITSSAMNFSKTSSRHKNVNYY